MAITVIHSKRYAFAWHIIGRSWYVPSDPVNDYAIGESKPNYPVPAIIYEVDFMYEWPSNRALATVLWYNSNPSFGSICLEYWT